MNLTPADVQRVARTYFTDASRMVLTVLPKGAPQTGRD
jgi:predicted Zn-dependent peptidase